MCSGDGGVNKRRVVAPADTGRGGLVISSRLLRYDADLLRWGKRARKRRSQQQDTCDPLDV